MTIPVWLALVVAGGLALYALVSAVAEPKDQDGLGLRRLRQVILIGVAGAVAVAAIGASIPRQVTADDLYDSAARSVSLLGTNSRSGVEEIVRLMSHDLGVKVTAASSNRKTDGSREYTAYAIRLADDRDGTGPAVCLEDHSRAVIGDNARSFDVTTIQGCES